MTAQNRGGRPSNQLLRERAELLRMELRVARVEREQAFTETAALARRARFVVLSGGSPLGVLEDIERVACRELTRAKAA